MTNELPITADQTQMTLPPTEPSKQPTSAGTPISKTLKFSKKRLALAFAIAGISDAIGVDPQRSSARSRMLDCSRRLADEALESRLYPPTASAGEELRAAAGLGCACRTSFSSRRIFNRAAREHELFQDADAGPEAVARLKKTRRSAPGLVQRPWRKKRDDSTDPIDMIASNCRPSMEQVAYSEFDDMHLLIQSNGAVIDARE